jgi:hypothetical protein
LKEEALDSPVYFSVLGLTIPVEAFAAVHRAIAAGLERHLRGYAATVADHFVHLAIAAVGVLRGAARGAACGATAGLVLESFVSKELLLAGREHELLATVPTGKRFVFKHHGFLQIVNLCPKLSSDYGVDFHTSGHRCTKEEEPIPHTLAGSSATLYHEHVSLYRHISRFSQN